MQAVVIVEPHVTDPANFAIASVLYFDDQLCNVQRFAYLHGNLVSFDGYKILFRAPPFLRGGLAVPNG